jgi:hypothetical protein
MIKISVIDVLLLMIAYFFDEYCGHFDEYIHLCGQG